MWTTEHLEEVMFCI